MRICGPTVDRSPSVDDSLYESEMEPDKIVTLQHTFLVTVWFTMDTMVDGVAAVFHTVTFWVL